MSDVRSGTSYWPCSGACILSVCLAVHQPVDCIAFALLPFWRFLAPSTHENTRERTIDGLAEFLRTYYKRPVTYMAVVFWNSHPEMLSRDDLRMVDAHGLSAHSAHLLLDDLRDTLSNHIFTGGCAGWLPHSIANLLVDCLDCLQESVFSDKVKSQYSGHCSCSDLGDAVVNNTSGTCRSFGADCRCFE